MMDLEKPSCVITVNFLWLLFSSVSDSDGFPDRWHACHWRLALCGLAAPHREEAWPSTCIICPVIHSSTHFCRGDCRDSQPSFYQLINQYLWPALPPHEPEEWAAAIEMTSLGCLEFQHSEKDSDLLWSQTGVYHTKEIAKYLWRWHITSRVHSLSCCLRGQVS